MKQMWSLLSKSPMQWEEKHKQMTVDIKGALQEVLCFGRKSKSSAHFRKLWFHRVDDA